MNRIGEERDETYVGVKLQNVSSLNSWRLCVAICFILVGRKMMFPFF